MFVEEFEKAQTRMKKKLVIADGDSEFGELLIEEFQDLYHCAYAGSVEELKRVVINGNAVILDKDLPGLDLTMSWHICGGVPVIYTSCDQSFKIFGFKYFTKPFNLKFLRKEVDECISSKGANQISDEIKIGSKVYSKVTPHYNVGTVIWQFDESSYMVKFQASKRGDIYLKCLKEHLVPDLDVSGQSSL